MPTIKPYALSHHIYNQIDDAICRALMFSVPGNTVRIVLLADLTIAIHDAIDEVTLIKAQDIGACEAARLERQLEELAALHPGVQLRFIDERSPVHYRDVTFCHTGNARAFESAMLAGRYLSAEVDDPAQRELFVVDQHALGASAKGARCRHTQAVLTVDRSALTLTRFQREAMLANEALAGMLCALGTGIVQDWTFDRDRLYHHKTILLMGTDLEGLRLQAVVLACLDHYVPELIAAGRVFLAHAPRFRVQVGATPVAWYAHSKQDLLDAQEKLPLDARKRLRVTPCQGLGELGAEALRSAAMDPRTRRLERVQQAHITSAWALLDVFDALDHENGQFYEEMADFRA